MDAQYCSAPVCPYSAPLRAPQAAQCTWAGKLVCGVWAVVPVPFLIALPSNLPAVHSVSLSPFSARRSRSYSSLPCEAVAGWVPCAGHIWFTVKTSGPLQVDAELTFVCHSRDAHVTFVLSAECSSYLYRNSPNLAKPSSSLKPTPVPGFLRTHLILKKKRFVASPN